MSGSSGSIHIRWGLMLFDLLCFDSYSLVLSRFASLRICFDLLSLQWGFVDISLRSILRIPSISLAPLALRRSDRYFVDSLRYSTEARRFAEGSQGSAGEAFELRGGAETYYSTINLQS